MGTWVLILHFSIFVSTFEVSILSSSIFSVSFKHIQSKLFTCVVWLQEYLEVSSEATPKEKS